MLQETFTLIIKKPREEVFRSLTDFDHFAKTVGDKAKVERVSGKGLGEVIRIKTQQAGAPELLCTTTEWDPPSRCTRRLDLPDLPTTVAFTLGNCPEGTTLKVDLTMEPKSMIYKMLIHMLQQKIKEEKEKTKDLLQKRLGAQ